MGTMTLHAQADLWQHGPATFAALFMEGETHSPANKADRTDGLLHAVMNRGLRLATDLPRLPLSPRRGWAIHLNPAGALTLTWPHAQPLLLDAPLKFPTGWQEAAAEHGLVLLFVGESLGLCEHAENHQTSPGQRSPDAAERGELAAGAIAYPYPRQQQETHAASHPRAELASRAVRIGGDLARHMKPSASTSHSLIPFIRLLRRGGALPPSLQTGEPMSPHHSTLHPYEIYPPNHQLSRGHR